MFVNICKIIFNNWIINVKLFSVAYVGNTGSQITVNNGRNFKREITVKNNT